MANLITATKLASYDRCPKQYQLKYQYKLGATPIKSAMLGVALHEALADTYRQPACKGKPGMAWLADRWQEIAFKHSLGTQQTTDGNEMLTHYWRQFIEPLNQWREPVGVEGRIEGEIYSNRVSFKISGRYDLLLNCSVSTEARLQLIDFKTSRNPRAASPLETDLQLGLYQIALEQRYGGSLELISHRYIKSGDNLSFVARPEQRELVRMRIEKLVEDMLRSDEFVHKPGAHCKSCPVKSWCEAGSENPLPLHEAVPIRVQLSFC